MARIPERTTVLKFLSIGLLLLLAGGGVFFVLAPYQASRLRADLADWIHARGGAPLVLATAAEGGAYYALGDQLRLHLDATRSYKIEVKATQGSMANLAMLREGKADLALIQGGLAAERNTAESDWPVLAPAQERLVALANLGRQYVHVVVPADSEIQEFRDLAGKRLGVGASGGGAEALAKDLMRFFRFNEATELVPDHNANLVNAFLDDEIDAAFTVYGLFAPAMEELLASGWYRLIPMGEADAVSRFLPGTFSETLPPYLYGPDRSIPPAGDKPFSTLSVNTLLVCQSSLANRQVYTVLEEIFSGPFLKMARLTALDEEGAQDALHLPLHPAAEAFYNRRDPISSDRFEILSFFLAGIVCIASSIHFVAGRLRVSAQANRRKAIRPYFEAMMDYGDAVENATNPGKLACLVHKVMATQRGAERKWLEGEFDTEDMENLYAVYSLRCNNAFNKIFDMHLRAIRGIGMAEEDSGSGADGDWGRNRASGGDSWSRSTLAPREDGLERYRAPARPAPAPAPARVEEDEEDDFFSGGPLAGIDHTKKDVAATLPPGFDAGLLYDTEASGAGAVRIRTPRPAAELQASVDRHGAGTGATRVEPEVKPEDDPEYPPEDGPGHEIGEAPVAPEPEPGKAPAIEPALRGEEPEPPEDKPDQLMLF